MFATFISLTQFKPDPLVAQGNNALAQYLPRSLQVVGSHWTRLCSGPMSRSWYLHSQSYFSIHRLWSGVRAIHNNTVCNSRYLEVSAQLIPHTKHDAYLVMKTLSNRPRQRAHST